MSGTEQLSLITPEYALVLNELDSLVASLLDQFPEDIEYSHPSLRLPLQSESMDSDTYYTLTKELPYPYPEGPDWSAIPTMLGQVTDRGDGGGCVTHYEMIEGILTTKSYPYENSEFLDEEPHVQELSTVEIRKLIEDLSSSHPVHPDKSRHQQVVKNTRIGSFIKRVLFRK